MTTTNSPIRLYARPPGGRWALVGEYPTRDAAWNALAAVPKGWRVWLNDVPTSPHRP